MKVRSEFVSQLSLYLDNRLNLDAFREWQVRQFLEREKLDATDQAFLAVIDTRYADLLAGLAEEEFKESLRCLLPSVAKQAPVEYAAHSYVLTTSSVLVEVPPSAGQAISVSGAFIENEAIVMPCLPCLAAS